jgi:IMP dehydrogenase
MTIKETVEKLLTFYNHGWNNAGISVGVTDKEYMRADSALTILAEHINCIQKHSEISPGFVINNNPRLVIMVDVAHGDHLRVTNIVRKINKQIVAFGLEGYVFIIAGNIATYDAAKRLIEVGVHGLKVGIGNGSLCETRIRTGVGVPQVSALLEIFKHTSARRMGRDASNSTRYFQITVMADGGIKYPGDVVKALWLGADSIMTGYMFAGTNETPGTVIKKGLFPNEREVKFYRGSASNSSKSDRGESRNVEGNIKEVPVKGSADYVFEQIKEGIQSGFSYVGATCVADFRKTARVVRITNNGVIEAKPNIIEQ